MLITLYYFNLSMNMAEITTYKYHKNIRYAETNKTNYILST